MTKAETKEKLLEIASVIRKGWTQKAYARDAEGNSVLVNDPKACSWCIKGALHHVRFACHADRIKVYNLCDNAIRAISTGDYTGIVFWNDAPGRTQAEVIELLEKLASDC